MDKIIELILLWQQEILKIEGVEREKYFKEIVASLGSKPIKIITGFRRSGKSFLVMQIAKHLVNSKQVKLENILYLNFEDFRLLEYKNEKKLHEVIKVFENSISSDGKKYLLLDEIQLVKNRDKLIRTIYELNKNDNYEIIITGSNSELLSSELGTNLAGRFIEFNILSFEFREFLMYKNIDVSSKNDYLREKNSINKLLDYYIRYGGIPESFDIESPSSKFSYIEGIINKVILDDIVKRFGIRDVGNLEKILFFIFSDIGSSFSPVKISNRFKSLNKTDISENQIIKYANYLEKTFGICECSKLDFKLNKIFERTRKYYCSDIGLMSVLSKTNDLDIDKRIENLIFLFLRKYNKDITFIQNKEGKEIDFYFKKGNVEYLVQVTVELNDRSNQRELGNFSYFSKYRNNIRNILVVLYGESESIEYNGEKIEVISLSEFLLFFGDNLGG